MNDTTLYTVSSFYPQCLRTLALKCGSDIIPGLDQVENMFLLTYSVFFYVYFSLAKVKVQMRKACPSVLKQRILAGDSWI